MSGIFVLNENQNSIPETIKRLEDTERGLKEILDTIKSVEVSAVEVDFAINEAGEFSVFPTAIIKVIGNLKDVRYKEYEKLESIAETYSFKGMYFRSLDTFSFGPDIEFEGYVSGWNKYTIFFNLKYDGGDFEKTITFYNIKNKQNILDIKVHISEIAPLGYKNEIESLQNKVEDESDEQSSIEIDKMEIDLNSGKIDLYTSDSISNLTYGDIEKMRGKNITLHSGGISVII